MADTWKAKGHTANVFIFDTGTVMLPLNEREASRLRFALAKQIDRLKGTGDFPEEKEYRDLLSNLTTACWLLGEQFPRSLP